MEGVVVDTAKHRLICVVIVAAAIGNLEASAQTPFGFFGPVKSSGVAKPKPKQSKSATKPGRPKTQRRQILPGVKQLSYRADIDGPDDSDSASKSAAPPLADTVKGVSYEEYEEYSPGVDSHTEFIGPMSSGWWVEGDFLMWWLRPMNVPPLVTTGTVNSEGVFQQSGTEVLVGNELMTDMFSGGRLKFGVWSDPCAGTGWEVELFGIGEQTDSYTFSGNGDSGSSVLARPFFNVLTSTESPSGQEDAELVAYPDQLAGTVSVDATSRLYGVGVHRLWKNCDSCSCGATGVCGNCVSVRQGVSTFLGWRYLDLAESLNINEDLTSLLDAPNDGRFLINDRFETKNQFNGADIGVMWKRRRGNLTLDMLMRVAIGTTRQQVSINGSTSIRGSSNSSNNFENANGGLLAQRTNIGEYSRDQFSMIPEVGITIGTDLSPCWRFTVGYSLLFWGSVVRPGDQIDRNVNPNLLPPETIPFSGLERPEFEFVETDLWLHGLSLGLERSW